MRACGLWRRRRQEEVRVLVTTPRGVLLLERPFPPVWEMPGGAIEPGESAAAAAQRETEEETGLVVELTARLGTFRRSGWLGGTVHLYRAVPVAGRPVANATEARRLAYVAPGTAIRLMLPWHRPYWARAESPPSDEHIDQRVTTVDVVVMLGLIAGHRLGLLRDPVGQPAA